MHYDMYQYRERLTHIPLNNPGTTQCRHMLFPLALRSRHTRMQQAVFITASCCWVQVADSPFASFEMLVQDIGRRYILPPFIVQPTLDSLVQAIQDKTGRNILDASPLALARATTGAVLLGKFALLPGCVSHVGW
jgi:hypothetical protein